MDLNLLVGGPCSEWPEGLLESNQEDKIWIGADRGALHLVKSGIKPKWVIGDFDSSAPAEKELIKNASPEIITARPEKDDTDTELALKEIIKRYGSCKIKVFGATGGRLDHLLANLFFVLREPFYKYMQNIKLYDKHNTVSFFKPGNYQLKKEKDKRYLAFVPLTAVKKLTLKDEKYRLDKMDFAVPVSLPSNEFQGPTANFSFETGVVCVIQSKD
ncbi:thiamine pyrophosphokinase [Liquorilactobacillus aquaticus DSM 21051]|uniref:Thiamine diphosphokinase n=1 Tax=Liquorilactobacillus aquaticus DSM 21051 TaxID=1423725 RepID=A0A0R2CXJ6_9LACO|nr:thiamine diphosphokinase [Liquorilactobacillus aquaticus]KRM96568.1 thiamine pyrophosphokinase [Liquorilactobacillus aquaticus DSM 21051]